MATQPRRVEDLVKPTIRKDVLFDMVKRAGQTTPIYSRSDIQEPLYTMILTAFFGLICVVLSVLFPQLVAPLVILLALVMACFGYEWHTWVFMRRMNRAVEDAAQVAAWDKKIKLLRASQNVRAKREQRERQRVFKI